MTKEPGSKKLDPNTEAFQMRAQWKKADICRKQWYDRWAWLLDERKKYIEDSDALRKQAAKALPQPAALKPEHMKSLKPVPVTSTGFIGWISTKPDCQLEIYTSWLSTVTVPRRLPDAWEYKEYVGRKES